MYNQIRPFERKDIPRVASLFMRTFREGEVTEDLLTYFDTIFFSNPWFDPEVMPLVYEDAGEVVAFIAVVPRRMRLGNSTLRVAVVGSYMFDIERRTRQNAFGAVEIIRKLMDGPQDLTISDTANDDSRQIWEMCGGRTSYLYSFRWICPIRPIGLGYYVLRSRKDRFRAAMLSPMGRLLTLPADFLFRMSGYSSYSSMSNVNAVATDFSTSEILETFSKLSQFDLLPYYETQDLSWLLKKAAEKRSQGSLSARIVKSSSSQTLGWFVYYQNPSGLSQVLQICAVPHALGKVFDCLLQEALKTGTLGLTGRLCPTMTKFLTQRRCIMSSSLSWTLFHARDPEIVRAFDRGTALFSGLEGEQWLRLTGGDSFQA